MLAEAGVRQIAVDVLGEIARSFEHSARPWLGSPCGRGCVRKGTADQRSLRGAFGRGSAAERSIDLRIEIDAGLLHDPKNYTTCHLPPSLCEELLDLTLVDRGSLSARTGPSTSRLVTLHPFIQTLSLWRRRNYKR